MKKTLGAALLVIVALMAMARVAPSNAAPDGLAGELAGEINAYRQSLGLAPLVWDTRLYNASHAHNDLMGRLNQMSHQLPGEADFGARIQNSGFAPMYAAGETLAAGSYDAANVRKIWQGSPGHDAIMRGDFTSIGCELAQYAGTTYGSYATCDFGKTDVAAEPSAPPRPGMIGGRIYRFQFYMPAARDGIVEATREICASQQLSTGRFQGQVGAGCYFYGTTADNQPPTSKAGWAYVEFRDFTAYYKGMKDRFISLMPSDATLWRFVETAIP